MNAFNYVALSMRIENLIREVKATRNTTYLIKYLRDGFEVTPELGVLIADILEGKFPATLKPITNAKMFRSDEESATQIGITIDTFQNILNRDSGVAIDSKATFGWNEAIAMLKESGYECDYDKPWTKGDITKAAKHLTAHIHHLTYNQLDEIIHPRKARN